MVHLTNCQNLIFLKQIYNFNPYWKLALRSQSPKNKASFLTLVMDKIMMSMSWPQKVTLKCIQSKGLFKYFFLWFWSHMLHAQKNRKPSFFPWHSLEYHGTHNGFHCPFFSFQINVNNIQNYSKQMLSNYNLEDHHALHILKTLSDTKMQRSKWNWYLLWR